MLRVLKAQRFSNLFDCTCRIEHPLFGYGNHLQLYVLLRRLARFMFHQIPEIIGRKTNLVCEILYSRDAFLRCRPQIEIIVQKPLETSQRIVIHVLARDELPLVETHAIVEQHLDVGNDKRFGEFVDRNVMLILESVLSLRSY